MRTVMWHSTNARLETWHQIAIKAVKRDNLTTKLFENLQSEIQILKSLSHRQYHQVNQYCGTSVRLDNHSASPNRFISVPTNY